MSRADERTCSGCGLSEVTMLENDDMVLECRRFPPMTEYPELVDIDNPEEAPAELLAEREEVVEIVANVHRFPRVRSDDWCGEWRAER